MDILSHRTLSFHVHLSLLHRYCYTGRYFSCSCTIDTRIHYSTDTVISFICIIATQILCTQLFHVLVTLLRRFTCIYALIISVFLLYGSLFLLYGYSYISVTWLFPITNIDMLLLLLDISVVDMRYVKLSATWI